jgi:predicted dienelactone hydrolase
MRYLPIAATVVVLLHLAVESYRWQVVPAYALTGCLLALSVRGLGSPGPDPSGTTTQVRSALSIIGAAAGFVALGVATATPVLFPTVRLPEPTGPHSVGTTYLRFTDHARQEPYTADPHDRRVISAQVWYPSHPEERGEFLVYMKPDVYRAVARFESLPSVIYSDLASVRTHSILNARLPGGRAVFPVLVFSHGASGHIARQTVLMEELASHGYVVFNVAHAYLSAFTVDASGKTISYDRGAVDAIISEATSAEVESIKSQMLCSDDTTVLEPLYKDMLAKMPTAVEGVRVRAADVSSLINKMAELNRGHELLGGRLDLARIGVMGFSLGGATAAQACMDDARCKAGVNLDGMMIGDLLARSLTIPFMFVTSEEMAEVENGRIRDRLQELFFNRVDRAAFMVAIAGSSHANLTDWSLLGGLMKYTGVLGQIDGARCLKARNVYVRSFFDQYLKNKPSRLLRGPSSEYPEVQINRRDG